MAVYFAQHSNGRIKIGKSYAVRKRLKTLSAQNGGLKLLGVIEGGLNEESELHSRFDKTRVTGEWFLPTTELLDFIACNTVAVENLTETAPINDWLESVVENLAPDCGLANPQQLAIKAAIPYLSARNVWEGDISNKSLKTLNKVAKALNCSIEDLFIEVEINDNL